MPSPDPEQAAAGILTSIWQRELKRLAHAGRQAQFDCDALAVLQGMPGKRALCQRLTAWRQTPRQQRAKRMPALAQLLHRSFHAVVRSFATAPDPEEEWLGRSVLGLFGQEWFAGKVVRIDRQVQHGKRKLPLQLLVRYEDGDEAHLDEAQVRTEAEAYRFHAGSQSRQFSEISTGGAFPAKRRRR